jgi:NAD(P)-dependent dehydrogenase (short-subunit alcohol dehydrogenase family)
MYSLRDYRRPAFNRLTELAIRPLMTPWHTLADCTIWITGGAGYLGSVITEALDQSAAKTICLDLSDKAQALVRDRRLTRTIPATCDVSNASALSEVINRLVAEHGVPDGVVHLAFASSSGRTLEELPVDVFQRTFDQTLPSTFELCRTVAEHMKPRRSGSIVLFSSMYGVVAPDPRIYNPPLTPNPIDYGASKAALLQMTRYFAVHYGPAGIRFNSITPGPFPNPAIQRDHPAFVANLGRKTALQRIGTQHEIIGPALFLLTDSASFITGHTLAVDGGWTAW